MRARFCGALVISSARHAAGPSLPEHTKSSWFVVATTLKLTNLSYVYMCSDVFAAVEICATAK